MMKTNMIRGLKNQYPFELPRSKYYTFFSKFFSKTLDKIRLNVTLS